MEKAQAAWEVSVAVAPNAVMGRFLSTVQAKREAPPESSG